MVKSRIVQVRFKPEDLSALNSIQKFAGIKDLSKTVRQLVNTGVNFYQHRKTVIDKNKKDIEVFMIKPEELYPQIRYKRKYLDWGLKKYEN